MTTSFTTLNKSQLESLKREQINAIESHKKASQYSSNPTNSTNTLKRLQQRLNEIESALVKFI